MALADRKLVSGNGIPPYSDTLEMFVQALPSQTKVSGVKPAFQLVAEILQQERSPVPYITITHVVPRTTNLEEVPASPPATPSTAGNANGYFDVQTIFTRMTESPGYHEVGQLTARSVISGTTRLSPPGSVHISIFERYIPPTTAQEVQELFSVTGSSHLVDRLGELSPRNGTLLFVYPTKAGAGTFAKQYIGPVLDPFLRQFQLLNNLTMDVAAALGNIQSLACMPTFEEMHGRLTGLCQEKSQLLNHRGAGIFEVIHAERVEIIIDRDTWINWFIQQESPRIRQKLIDYQKNGGRMPSSGFSATPGFLAREVVEGIMNSKEEAGGAGIEVGAFVVRFAAV